MRLPIIWVAGLAAIAAGAGCAPEVAGPGNTGLVGVVAGITESNSAASLSPSATPAASAPTNITGSITTSGEYQLFEFGSGVAGEEWAVADADGRFGGSSFLVVLFNSEYELLQREIVSGSLPLEHILRADAAKLYIGVTPSYGGGGGDFDFQVSRRMSLPVPAPRRQAVWLNFGAGANVDVHARSGLSFPAFDARLLGSEYAGATESVKAAILETMREDYAPYDVVIVTSDEGPPPAGPYATVHFGGQDHRLLGLADNVDQYNADPWQKAVIYVQSFAEFSVMALTAEEMGQMVGNVASHELGHLLGLFHTQVPTDLMDTTGTAWDLAGSQSFTHASLEPTVFPFGFENSPRRLADAVGYNPDTKVSALAKPALTEKMLRRAALRALARDELRGRCGTCLNLDD